MRHSSFNTKTLSQKGKSRSDEIDLVKFTASTNTRHLDLNKMLREAFTKQSITKPLKLKKS
jgi:hypothetical protein